MTSRHAIMETSLRTGPWPPAQRAPFRVPGCAHVLLSPLPGIPESACGADPADPDLAKLRCDAEAVERITAWVCEMPASSGSADLGRLDPNLFSQDECHPVPSGEDGLVQELFDVDTARGLFLIDRAAICLGTTGWFPAGSTGYAAAPSRKEAIGSGAWEVLERDLLTTWWRGSETATRHKIDHENHEELETEGIDLIEVRIGSYCSAVLAFDKQLGLAAVGSSAGCDDIARTRKASQEALITLAQLKDLLPADSDERPVLEESPAELATGLEHTLHALLDSRFGAEIRCRFEEVSCKQRGSSSQINDPVLLLRNRGYRTFFAELSSPESEWAGLTVVRVIAAGAATPLPRSLRPFELPVPLV